MVHNHMPNLDNGKIIAKVSYLTHRQREELSSLQRAKAPACTLRQQATKMLKETYPDCTMVVRWRCSHFPSHL